jgi:hypothetical protein
MSAASLVRNPPITRIAALVALGLVLGLALAGCGSAAKSAPKATKLSSTKATSALLSLADVGGTFKVDDAADHTTPSPGCLVAIDAITYKIDAPTTEDVDYESTSAQSFPVIYNQVSSFGTVAVAKKRLDTFRAAMHTCTSVAETSSGVFTKLTVTTNNEKASAKDDDEVNVKAVGAISQGSQETPLGVFLAVVREGNNLAILEIGDVTQDAPAAGTGLVSLARARLAAVIKGTDPDNVS